MTWLLLLVLASPGVARAHFHLLIPASPAAVPGDAVKLRYLFGHPYEHELQKPRAPKQVTAHPPAGPAIRLEQDGKAAATLPASKAGASKAVLTKTPAGKTAGAKDADPARIFSYTPEVRGDHIITAEAAPVIDHERRLIIKDHLKVVVHALSQNGWARKVGQPLELVPLTRPYGLRPGWTFQAVLLRDGKPVEGAEVEVEKFNEAPPARPLPQDEFITRTARSGPGGTVTVSLDAKGWWAVSACVHAGKEPAGKDKEYPVLLRTILWVYVGEPLERKPKGPEAE